MAWKRGVADGATDESAKSSLGEHLSSDMGKKVHVRRKRTSGSNHFRCSTSAPHPHIFWSDASLGGKDGFVKPSVKGKPIAEIPGIELHGEVRMPVLETACDEAFGAINVLEHVLVAV